MNINRVIHRYIVALIGGFLAMAGVIFVGFVSRVSLRQPQLWSDILGVSLTFAHLFAFMVIAAHDIPVRLHRVPRVVQGIMSMFGGFGFSMLAWLSYHVLFLANISPDWLMLAVGTIGLALPYIIATLWRIKPDVIPVFVLITINWVLLTVPILLYLRNYLASVTQGDSAQSLLYFDAMRDAYLVVPLFALILALFGHVPMLWLHDDRA